jgi:ATP-binding cassette subfamily B protein
MAPQHRVTSPLPGPRKALPFLVKEAFRYPLHVLTAFGSLAITAGSILSLGQALRHFFDTAALKAFPTLFSSLLLMGGVALVIAASSYVRTYTTAWLGERITRRLRHAFFTHILSLSHSFFDHIKTADLIERFSTDLHHIRSLLAVSTPVLVRSILQLLGGLILLIKASPPLTVMMLCVVFSILIPIFVLGKMTQRLTKNVQKSDSDLLSLFKDILEGMTIVKSFTAEKYLLNRFQNLEDVKAQAIQKRLWVRSLLISCVIGLVFLGILGILWVGLTRIGDGTLTPGQLSAFIFYGLLVAGSLNNMGDVSAEAATALAAAQRYCDLMAARPIITSPPKPLPLPNPSQLTITCQDLLFDYQDQATRPALTISSLTLSPGQKIALVGPSGSGKTTFFKLLQRFYDPQRGMILLNGVSHADLSLETLRSCFSVIPQDPPLFNGSLFDNISFARPEATEQEVLEAARFAAVTDFSHELPLGLYSSIGDQGNLLSGGQKQRIAWARALLKNAPVYLLDEATNALDNILAHQINTMLSSVLADKTIVTIAHSLTSVQSADTILVFDKGAIVAQGSHQKLLEGSPLYQDLYEKQLRGSA